MVVCESREEIKDLREKGEQMAEQLREVERARIEARGVGQEEVELVVWDRRQLKKEVEELKTGNKVRGEKWEGERAKLQEQVGDILNVKVNSCR